MKGWTVAWTQNKVSFSLLKRVSEKGSYRFIDPWFVCCDGHGLFTRCNILLCVYARLCLRKKKALVSYCCPPYLIVCLYVISVKGFSDMGKRVRLQAWRKREVVWYQREESSAFFEFQGFTGFVAAVGVLSLSWERFCHIFSLLSVSHKDVCHCSSPFYLAKELWYTLISTLLEFFTSLIIHSPSCSPAWFLRCKKPSIAIFSLQTVHAHCDSKFFFFNHIFFIIFLTMEPFQEPSFPSQMMMTTSGSSLPLSILPHTQHLLFHPNPRKIGKMISQHYWWIWLRRNFFVNNMNSLTQ
jgi:hypothetical protein